MSYKINYENYMLSPLYSINQLLELGNFIYKKILPNDKFNIRIILETYENIIHNNINNKEDILVNILIHLQTKYVAHYEHICTAIYNYCIYAHIKSEIITYLFNKNISKSDIITLIKKNPLLLVKIIHDEVNNEAI